MRQHTLNDTYRSVGNFVFQEVAFMLPASLSSVTIRDRPRNKKATIRSPFYFTHQTSYPAHFLAFRNMLSHAPFICRLDVRCSAQPPLAQRCRAIGTHFGFVGDAKTDLAGCAVVFGGHHHFLAYWAAVIALGRNDEPDTGKEDHHICSEDDWMVIRHSPHLHKAA